MAIKSPFPGLDPYLEMHWGDVHHSLIQYTRDALQEMMPDDLISRVEERVFVESFDDRIRAIVPDVHVVESKPSRTAEDSDVEANGGVALAESRTYVFDDIEQTEGYIEIREASGGKVVTVIEFLSPANKVGRESMALYRQKQRELMLSDTSLVEIDLVRSGQRVIAMNAGSIPPEWANDSLVLVRRGWQGNQVKLFHMPLRVPLSPVPIPLRRSDKTVYLDLQSIHDECYRKGRYDRLDYAAPIQPPLTPDDAAWAQELLAAAGKRPR